MSYEPSGRYTVCPKCAGLAGHPEGRDMYPQTCRCTPGDGERWPDRDFNEYTDLCWCCQLEAIPSGHKFHLFYCDDCRRRVRPYNHLAGRTVLYIGRHSVMAGVFLRGPDTRDPQLVAAFAGNLADFGHGILAFFTAMDVWRPERHNLVLSNLASAPPAAGQEPIALDAYLQEAATLADHPQLGKQAAFSALCRHLALPTPEDLGLKGDWPAEIGPSEQPNPSQEAQRHPSEGHQLTADPRQVRRPAARPRPSLP